jgi:subtilisin family serine protease
MKLFFSLSLTIALLASIVNIKAQDSQKKADKKTIKAQNWHHLDPKKDKIVGISTEKAYTELLKGKKQTRVIVAVIDGGVDVKHEDLKDKIWINEDEIAGNGIDDDNNGFIDDIHGWNFLGNAKGENINEETLEVTRLYKKYSDTFKNSDTTSLAGNDLAEFLEFKKIRTKYAEKYNEAKEDYSYVKLFQLSYNISDSLIKAITGKSNYTLKDIEKLKTRKNKQLADVKNFMIRVQKRGITREKIEDNIKYLDARFQYHLNPDSIQRYIIGDNQDILNDMPYGNNDVTGPDAGHGTMVAGIIAAARNNNLGMNGINDSVKIMAIRAVPDGDEYDKDVANSIIYAVNNGAQIINCSFGKNYSPQKKFVDEAIKLAQAKGVLIVHAAGNDAEDNDSIMHYPTNLDASGKPIMDNWITVGASSFRANKELPATFSNYGQKSVDLFAPGTDIYTTKPGSKYGAADGTSFSSPVVAGTAALLKSIYPKLTAAQIKEIIRKSSIKYPNLKVNLPSEDKGKSNTTVLFGNLSATGGVVNVYEALKLAEQY